MNDVVRKSINARALIALVGLAAVCLVISGPTKDKPGAEGALSWVTFVGFWVLAPVAVALTVALVARRVAGRMARR